MPVFNYLKVDSFIEENFIFRYIVKYPMIGRYRERNVPAAGGQGSMGGSLRQGVMLPPPVKDLAHTSPK